MAVLSGLKGDPVDTFTSPGFFFQKKQAAFPGVLKKSKWLINLKANVIPEVHIASLRCFLPYLSTVHKNSNGKMQVSTEVLSANDLIKAMVVTDHRLNY